MSDNVFTIVQQGGNFFIRKNGINLTMIPEVCNYSNLVLAEVVLKTNGASERKARFLLSQLPLKIVRVDFNPDGRLH